MTRQVMPGGRKGLKNGVVDVGGPLREEEREYVEEEVFEGKRRQLNNNVMHGRPHTCRRLRGMNLGE